MEYQPKLPPFEDQPELPIEQDDVVELLGKMDAYHDAIQEIDRNLSNPVGLTHEGFAELQASKRWYENELGTMLIEAEAHGLLGEGAPADNYEGVR